MSVQITMLVGASKGGSLALHKNGVPTEFTLRGEKKMFHKLLLLQERGHVVSYQATQVAVEYFLDLAERWPGAKDANIRIVVPNMVAYHVNGDWKAKSPETAVLLSRLREKLGELEHLYADIEVVPVENA